MTDAVFRDEVSTPPVVRIACACAAAMPFVLPARDLWHGLWPPNASTTFEVSPSGLRLKRRWPWARRVEVHSRETVDDVRVDHTFWSDGADNWRVQIIVAGKAVVRTRDLGTKMAAEATADENSRVLG